MEYVGIDPLLQGFKDLSKRLDLETPRYEDIQIEIPCSEDKPRDLRLDKSNS
jgi:hypothetical protein